MTDGEIISSYRQAKDKGKQITILAELNACTKGQIEDILTEAGYLKNGKPRKGPIPKNAIKPVAVAKPEKPKTEKSPKVKAVRITPKAKSPIFLLPERCS